MVSLPLVSHIQIRTANRIDLPALEWDGEFTHFRRLFAEAYRLVEQGEAIMWVAELPGVGIIGQLFVQVKSQDPSLADGVKRAYIYGFRVQALYRRAGIGSQLLKTAEEDLIQRGFQSIALNVGQDNPQARRLYERFGYRVVAPEPGIWSYVDHLGRRQQVNEPAWRMEKQI
jgi:ribosomal protein S18 acetylase RimI-like enzyme